jgi:hypothetical protein
MLRGRIKNLSKHCHALIRMSQKELLLLMMDALEMQRLIPSGDARGCGDGAGNFLRTE